MVGVIQIKFPLEFSCSLHSGQLCGPILPRRGVCGLGRSQYDSSRRVQPWVSLKSDGAEARLPVALHER